MTSGNMEVFFGQAHTVLASSGLVVLGRGRIGHVAILAGSADATALVYDGRDTNGTLIYPIGAPSAEYEHDNLEMDIRFDTGLYVAITGAGARFFISWQPTG